LHCNVWIFRFLKFGEFKNWSFYPVGISGELKFGEFKNWSFYPVGISGELKFSGIY
jgi:hypothetical protein